VARSHPLQHLLGKKCCGSGSEQPNNFFYSNPNADQPLLEMLMEILTLVGNLPRASCVVLSKAWGKNSINAWVFLSLMPW
jgi:hypothetical protein